MFWEELFLKFFKFWYSPPWFSAIDCSLSLTTIIKFDLISEPTKLRPSNASPPDKEPSPIIAITFSWWFKISLALTNPLAKEIDVEVWPTLNRSYIDSS